MADIKKYEISERNYRVSSSTIKFLLKMSPLKIHVHDLEDKAESGSIFLFNHFTRFETFIPQHLLYDRSKVICRSVADHELFDESMLGDYLRGVGAVPSNLENMMDFMVEELNSGRKLVIFPEGAMIKDRRVRDTEGRLAIYKREGGHRRKPHTGAAVMGIKCQIFRDLYMKARKKGDDVMVEYYSRHFPNVNTPAEIDLIASQPVTLVPANITFYPMRRDENILEKYVQRFAGIKSKRILEELKVEGNILLKETDMDVRFGTPIRVKDFFGNRYEAILKSHYIADSFDAKKGGWLKKVAAKVVEKQLDNLTVKWIKHNAEIMRDIYMSAIYDLTTINLGHLTAHTLFDLNKKNSQGTFDSSYLRSLLYLAISDLRNFRSLHLHRNISTRSYLNDLLTEDAPHLNKILERFEKAGLLARKEGGTFTLTAKLEEDFSFDTVRIENPALVLDNEVQSVPKAIESLDRLYQDERAVLEDKVALLLYRRVQKIFEQDKKQFEDPKYDGVNKNDRRTETGEPFFYRSGRGKDKRKGVLLIHGFSASPAEMKVLGGSLHQAGYDVFGMRLPGHGTSPADLRESEKEDWIKEAKMGLALISRYCPKIFLIGNSMGALVGLIAIGSSSFKPAAYVAIAPAFRIKDKRIALVSYVDAAQRVYELFSDLKTEWPYQDARPENPHINYALMPYHGLFELQQVSKDSQEYIEKLTIPTFFIQADKEYTLDPEATYAAFEKVPAEKKRLLKLDETRHVLTLDKDLPLFKEIVSFLEELEK
ncbi:MAG: alpha/beta fold hydrolase [Proteobacteria bacterium]|nr:alpha/beta fold hydrolase [Pseudomonadota bacterium]